MGPRLRWPSLHWRTTAYSSLASLLLLHHIHAYHYTYYPVRGASMSPALSPTFHETGRKDRVLFHRPNRYWAANTTSRLERGTVVLFWMPHDPEQMAVKRVVALAGDAVRPLRGRAVQRVYAMHREDESGASGCGCPAAEAEADELVSVTVPFGHVWVEGDNEAQSWDSNDYGPISLSLVQGVATRVLTPWDRAGPVSAEDGGWRERCGKRITWRGEREGEMKVPEEWEMY